MKEYELYTNWFAILFNDCMKYVHTKSRLN